ncbi:MAG: DHH family phosphoesterase [Deltaproteobacteria bacterium]|nr:DHH family phosphoesterase [Deltaproteobacteria bacterium]
MALELRAGNRFLVTAHLSPDGDALGSMLALGRILESLGKEVLLYNPDPVPRRYRFLPGSDRIARVLPAGERFDATIVVDCGDAKLLGPSWPGREVTGTVIVLDHHRTHVAFGDVVYRSDACAVGEMVFRIAERLGAALDREAAECIYASMTTDTGGFRYSSTTPDALRIAANLIERGVEPWKVSWHLFENWPMARLKLLLEVLGTLEVHASGRVAVLQVPRRIIDAHGASSDMIEGFINYARMLEGVDVSALVSEAEDGTVRASLRSVGRVAVDRVAAEYGGGGHLAAAGCTFPRGTTLAEATRRVVEALVAALDGSPELPSGHWSRR